MDRTKSLEALERCKRTIPGGVCSSIRALDNPLFLSHGKGSRVWDLDGNEYIDYVMAYGPLTLGHAPASVNDAIREQLDKGLIHGTGIELEYELAEEVVKHVPCAEQVRFGTTGSESIHMALRLARAHTGRDKIIKFEGNFHGTIADAYLSVNPQPPFGVDTAPWTKRQVAGQLASVEQDVIVLPFNDLDPVESVLKNRAHEIAAIILEPVANYNGIQPPVAGFLKGLRELTEKYGFLLIFDEVVTGFRLAPGGAQEFYDVVSDLCVMAKGVGCGVPIAAIGGKKKIMDTITNFTMPHYGTYNANALCLAGALAGIKELTRDNGAAIKHMHSVGRKLREGYTALFEKYDAPLYAQGVDPVFSVVSQEKRDTVNYRDTLARDLVTARKFRDTMFDRGVWFIFRGNHLLSTAHTEEDIEQTLNIAEDILDDGSWKTRTLD